ncbi:MAG: FkbM family methyltransferase [Sulfolobus sp.]
MFGRKIIFGLHGFIQRDNGIKGKIFRNVAKHETVHVLNVYDKSLMEKIGCKRIFLIPNFIYSNSSEIIRCNKFIVLFVGRLDINHKGIDLLVDIILKLKTNTEFHVDLLKIDVEGYEKEVLLGSESTLDRTDKVIIEVHERNKRFVDTIMYTHGLVKEKEELTYAEGSIYYVLYVRKR